MRARGPARGDGRRGGGLRRRSTCLSCPRSIHRASVNQYLAASDLLKAGLRGGLPSRAGAAGDPLRRTPGDRGHHAAMEWPGAAAGAGRRLAGDRRRGHGSQLSPPRSSVRRASCSAAARRSSGAIDQSMTLFPQSPYRGGRHVIDVSGDGSNNRGRSVTRPARDEAVAAGVVINGLPILTLSPISTATIRTTSSAARAPS